MIVCLQTRVRKQPIIALYFEFETVLKLYNLKVRTFRMTRVICIMHFAQKADQRSHPKAIK